jgi:hypothetical protein
MSSNSFKIIYLIKIIKLFNNKQFSHVKIVSLFVCFFVTTRPSSHLDQVVLGQCLGNGITYAS